jgi:hypothetical protein
VTPAAPAEKEEAPLSYEEAVQIAKDVGMSSSDIARCQRLAALSEDSGRGEDGHLRFPRGLVQPASSPPVYRLLVTNELREEDMPHTEHATNTMRGLNPKS